MADILVIDDDENLRLALDMTLKQQGHVCRLAGDAESGWSECQRQLPDLALLDLQLPDLNGLDLLARMREHGLNLPVIIMTAFGTITSAVRAMKQGAADFIEKPLSVKEVCRLVVNLLQTQELANHLRPPAEETAPEAAMGEVRLIGTCPQMREVLALAERIAALPTDAGIGLVTTLLLGETGTGKEMVARHIHGCGSNPTGPFVHVNCSAIPEHLFETEHFGHERGVFTDAKTTKRGLLEAADQGTLFLDEIGDMPLPLQAKLLVAIETGRFRRLGATTEQKVEMRVVAATNSDLSQGVEAGRFRKDLYHRLTLFQIELPPLRDRGDDIRLLADHFLHRFSRRLGKPPAELLPKTRAILERYPWPGNVRELAHVLLRVLTTHDQGPIQPVELAFLDSEVPPQTDIADVQFDFATGVLPLAAVEKKLLQAALQHAGGNITEAARLLGLTRGTLRYRLEKMGLI